MKSEIMAVARGAWCPARGERLRGKFSPGLDGAATESCDNKLANPIAPTPNPVWHKRSRRDGTNELGCIEELVGSQDLLAEVGQSGLIDIALKSFCFQKC